MGAEAALVHERNLPVERGPDQALLRSGSQLDKPAARAIGRRDGALGPVQIERLPERLLTFGCLPRAVEHVSQVFVGLASGEEHVGRVSEIDRFPRVAPTGARFSLFCSAAS